MKTKRKLKVFLSHIGEDTPIVQDLYEKLKNDGFLPWMDRMDLKPGDDWDTAITKALSESDVILVCLSQYSYKKEGGIQSEYRKIANLASEKPSGAIFTIPVRLEECNIPDPFRQIHHLDYFKTDGYERLIQSLRIRSEQLGTFAPSMPYRLDQIKEIQDQQKRAKALVDFARQSSDTETIGEILSETHNFTNVLARVVILRELAQYIEPGSDSLLQEALSIEEETARASVLAALPPHLNDELKSRALAATFEIQDKYVRVQTLTAFLPHLSKSQKYQVLRDAFSTMQAISDETLRATALSELAPYLDDELKNQAFAITREIKDEFTRVHTLSIVLPYLPYQEKTKGIREAFEVMQAIADENRRANALIELSPHLLDDELKIRALDMVRNFKDKSLRVRALSALSPHLSDEIKAKISEDGLSDEITQPPPLEIINIVRPFKVEGNALEKHVATDKPIQSVKQDKLDFKIYVNALHSFILSKYTTTPITISIDGVWGTGKSSLMSMLKGKLDPQRGGVRKFFEWCSLFLPRVKWYWRFLWSSLPKAYGTALIALAVRNDLDDDGIHLYFGDNVRSFKNHIASILDGFSVAPESINQPENEKTDKSVSWWAQINANCEPMEPPYHYTVWLNAWKFDNQEEVWASLALATMEQIKQKHGLFWRLRFWWELTFSRFSFWSGLWQVVKQFLLPLLFGIIAAYYNVILGSFDVQLDAFKQYGSPLLWTGAVISGILSISSIFKDPFQIPLDRVFDRPNYKDKVKFLSHFEKDFARIVRAATKNGFGWKRSKLVIFIDDLDRCEPPKSADIVEAVNLFLDAESCVFIIGMDSESVARSIEVKYKDLFERMKAENTGVVSLGRLFLDKIVQIPFSVPRPTSQQITSMVTDALGSKVLSLSVNISIGSGSKSSATGISDAPVVDTTPGQVIGVHAQDETEKIPPVIQPRVDPASYAKPEVRAAILKGTELLADNPRQVKTFINLFRLSIYIANERKILEEKVIADKTSGVNLEKLAIWTACSVRWQNLIRHLHSETQIVPLRNFLYSMSTTIQPSFTWAERHKIPDGIKTDYKKLRDDEKGSESHWCYLPWEWWLLEPDFLKTIKLMQDLWSPPSDGEVDWLEVLLTMTKPINVASSAVTK